MISLKELLGNADFNSQSKEIQGNLMVLLERVNKVRSQWPTPWTVTSGFRTMEDHIRIYKEKAAKASVPFDLSKVPMKSKHLIGAAVDIYDPDLRITEWLKANPEILEDAQLWCEEGNKNWTHFQILPPNSRNLWFLP